MTHESLLNRDWEYLVKRHGGAAFLERSARETGAFFLQARVIKSAVDLLRLLLAYCLGDHGFRLTAAWATSMGLMNISAPGLLYRLRQSGDWLRFLIDQLSCAAAPKGQPEPPDPLHRWNQRSQSWKEGQAGKQPAARSQRLRSAWRALQLL